MRIDIDRWEEIVVTLTRNKTRSLLTAFGVFWGIFMLVTLMGGSQGVQDLMSAKFSGFATNSGFTASFDTSKAYKGFRKGRIWDLENDDVKRIKSQVSEVDVISPILSRLGLDIVLGENKIEGSMRGVYPDYVEIEEAEMTYGRFINKVDVQERRKVCVIGKRIYEVLFPEGGNPCGTFICVNGIYYQVIGMNGSMGNVNIHGEAETRISIPFTTMQENYNYGKQVHLLCYTAKPGYAISEVQKKIEVIIKRAHLIHPDDKQALILVNAEAMYGMIDGLFKGIRMLSWLVGLGTLLAGIIGVSNIMMVTVKERTTEIGIRRAIGAKPIDILNQILSESMALTLLSGMMGVCLGVAILQLVETGLAQSGSDVHFQISFWMAIGACLVLLILGMLAGLAPAFRAMAIKPIEAIRDE
ncbi:MAG: ABC transporter permease [Phocaeicola sp.]